MRFIDGVTYVCNELTAFHFFPKSSLRWNSFHVWLFLLYVVNNNVVAIYDQVKNSLATTTDRHTTNKI
jgi:hypothetical protein